MADSPKSPVPAIPPQDVLDKGSAQQADRADHTATEPTDNVDGAMDEEETARKLLAEERMNRTMSLPECMCLRLPRTVSYAEVGDPSGYPVCIVCRWFCTSMYLSSSLVLTLFFKLNYIGSVVNAAMNVFHRSSTERTTSQLNVP